MDGFFEHWSYLGIIVFLILTGCGLPIPEEVAIIAAGVMSADPDGLHPGLAFGSCIIGAVLGDCVMYYIGRRFGRSVLHDHPRWSGVMTPEREQWIEGLIMRHGFSVFLVARFMVGLRAPVYITAGILKVPFWRFLVTDIICAFVVISIFFLLSYTYGDWVFDWIRRAELGVTIAVIAGIAAAVFFYWRHHRRSQIKKQNQSATSDPAASNNTTSPPAQAPLTNDEV